MPKNWQVGEGGRVLVIMENDTSFADLEHFNVISEKYGIHFNSVLRKHVEGTHWRWARSRSTATARSSTRAYDLHQGCVHYLGVRAGGVSAARGDDIFMARAKYGKAL